MKSFRLSTFLLNCLIIYLSILSVLICSICKTQSALAADGDVVMHYDVYEKSSTGYNCVIAEGCTMVFSSSGEVISADGNWIIELAFGCYHNIKTNAVIDYETYAPLANGSKAYTIDVGGNSYPITLPIKNRLEITDQHMWVAENAQNGDVVGRVYISSYDLADFSPTFTLQGGNINNVFAFSNASGGTVVVHDATKLDYENIDDYNLTVQVGNGTYTETANISISVTNVSDSPVIENQVFSIDENSNAGSTVGSVIVTKAYNYNLTYDITAGNTGNAFTINSSNGILKVNNKSSLNYEIDQAFTLTVQVFGGEYTPSAQMMININDVNEPPVVSNQSCSINENAAPGTNVYTVFATDQEDDSLTYRIRGGEFRECFFYF